MKSVRAIWIGLALASLFWPEAARYSAERRLSAASAAFDSLLSRPGRAAEVLEALERVTEIAVSATRGLPNDSRAWLLAGSSRLLGREGDRALGYYREAMSCGERAEIDLNMGRALALLDRRDDAEAAILRAAWVSPALLPSLPPDWSEGAAAEIARLEAELRVGRLEEPPPRPE